MNKGIFETAVIREFFNELLEEAQAFSNEDELWENAESIGISVIERLQEITELKFNEEE